MQITLISGSLRKNENSEKIISMGEKFFRKKGYDIESIKLSEINTKFCIHCDFCKKNDYCKHDEDANSINKILLKSDAIIAISPIYFGSISGQLKTLFDKTLPLRRADMALKGKIGGAITIGGSRNGGQEYGIKNIHAWMLIHGMITVGDNSHFGGAIQAPVENDDIGEKTANGTFEAVYNLLERIK
jgi:multimeric flavodoxin WrbA